MDAKAFQLSRVYGEGWNAAKRLGTDPARAAKSGATLNPYRTGEEQARWTKGFEEGLRSRTGAHKGRLGLRAFGREAAVPN